MTALTDAPASLPIPDLDEDNAIGIFEDGQALVGTQCRSCGCTMLGSRVVCSTCVGQDVVRVSLPRSGTLYAFTRLHVGSEGVRPLGYVDLDNGVRTLADLRETTEPLTPDMRVELEVDGDAWFFAPVSGEKREKSNE